MIALKGVGVGIADNQLISELDWNILPGDTHTNTHTHTHTHTQGEVLCHASPWYNGARNPTPQGNPARKGRGITSGITQSSYTQCDEMPREMYREICRERIQKLLQR